LINRVPNIEQLRFGRSLDDSENVLGTALLDSIDGERLAGYGVILSLILFAPVPAFADLKAMNERTAR